MGGELLLLLLRLGRCVAVGRVQGWGGGQGGVGVGGALAQAQTQVIMGSLLDQELLQAAVGGDTREEVLVGR